jgi:hypothetical protein
MKGERVRVSKKRKLPFHGCSDSRPTRSSTSKDEHTLHQEIVNLILVKSFPSHELFETACSH